MYKIINFFKNESGATAIEYGLLAALVSVAAIIAMTALGDSLDTLFSSVADSLCTAGGGTYSAAAGTCT